MFHTLCQKLDSKPECRKCNLIYIEKWIVFYYIYPDTWFRELYILFFSEINWEENKVIFHDVHKLLSMINYVIYMNIHVGVIQLIAILLQSNLKQVLINLSCGVQVVQMLVTQLVVRVHMYQELFHFIKHKFYICISDHKVHQQKRQVQHSMVVDIIFKVQEMVVDAPTFAWKKATILNHWKVASLSVNQEALHQIGQIESEMEALEEFLKEEVVLFHMIHHHTFQNLWNMYQLAELLFVAVMVPIEQEGIQR